MYSEASRRIWIYRLILIKYSLHIYNYMSIKYFWTVGGLLPVFKILIIVLNLEKEAVKWSFFVSFYFGGPRGFPAYRVQKTGVWETVLWLSCRFRANVSLY